MRRSVEVASSGDCHTYLTYNAGCICHTGAESYWQHRPDGTVVLLDRHLASGRIWQCYLRPD
ncbi:hypothetical protein POG22_00080 [Geitlerinema sp. CS-897]|nr:hypothetical protein [Geitlerinema sp. CS-897]